MPTISTLTVDVNANTSRFRSGMRLVGVGLAAAGAAAVAVGAKAVSAASDLEESTNKARVVFGEQGKAIIRWSQDSATAFGISNAQALESAGTFGNLFRAMQIGTGTSANMSKKLVGLAADLASFNNADPTEVLENLRSGLVGEAEPLRKFGIQLSAVRIEQEAARLGLKKQNKELSAAAKAQAAYSIIMQDSALAQGDFARTSDSVANQTRIARAELENMLARIGRFLIPIASALLRVFMDIARAIAENFGPWLLRAGDWLSDLWQRVKPVVTVIGRELWTSLTRTWGVIKEHFLPALRNLWDAFQPILKVVGAVIGLLIIGLARALPVVVRIIAGVVDVFAGLIRGILTGITKVKEGFVAVWHFLEDVFVGIGNAIIDGFEFVVNKVIDGLNFLIRGFNSIPFVPDISEIGHVQIDALRKSFSNWVNDVPRAGPAGDGVGGQLRSPLGGTTVVVQLGDEPLARATLRGLTLAARRF